MNFSETLPAECPPSTASELGFEEVFRAVRTNPPSAVDFKSQAALGRPKRDPSASDCQHASCSLFTCRMTLRNIFTKMPKPRRTFNYIATLKIPSYAGLSQVNDKHVDLWIYNGFDPLSAVTKVEQL